MADLSIGGRIILQRIKEEEVGGTQSKHDKNHTNFYIESMADLAKVGE
jgi:hypothetical protein